MSEKEEPKVRRLSLAAYAMITAILSLMGTALSLWIDISDFFDRSPRLEFVDVQLKEYDREPSFKPIQEDGFEDYSLVRFENLVYRIRLYNPSSSRLNVTSIFVKEGTQATGWKPLVSSSISFNGDRLGDTRSTFVIEPDAVAEIDLSLPVTILSGSPDCFAVIPSFDEFLRCQSDPEDFQATMPIRFEVMTAEGYDVQFDHMLISSPADERNMWGNSSVSDEEAK